MSDNENGSQVTVTVETPETPPAPEAPAVVVVEETPPAAPAVTDGTLAALLEIKDAQGEILRRLDSVEQIAYTAQGDAAVARIVAETEPEPAPEPEPEPEPQAPAAEDVEPQKAHWLHR